MRYSRPRGTRDIVPDEAPLWQWLEEKFRRVARTYLYEEIRTPVFELAPLFERTSGETSDIVTKQMYTFVDMGNDRLSLRPEGTASVVRAYIENGDYATRPLARYCYITPIFRHEAPQAGRYRQHHQVGVEALGSQDPALDAEVIRLGQHYLNDLGLVGFTIFINSVGCPACRPAHREALRGFLTPLVPQLSDDSKRRFDTNPMRILDSKDERDRELTRDAPVMMNYLCDDCRNHIARVQSHLLDLRVPFEIDMRLVRGLDYYTKTAFEFKHPGLGAQDTLIGGGRYDGLVEQLGGPSTPGIGFGGGIERALLAMKEDGSHPPVARTSAAIYIAPMGEEAMKKGVVLLNELRDLGIPSDISYGSRSLKSMMKQADRSGARIAVLLGEDELKNGQATVRRLDRSEQATLSLDNLARQLRTWIDSNPPAPEPAQAASP